MLKRLLLALLLMPLAVAGMAAQLTATLQSGDNLTPFYGTDAFKNALESAVDGDVITLSPGEFSTSEVTKGVTIIGTYAFDTDTSKITKFSDLTVGSNDITLEGVRITGSLTIKNTENLTINRCYLYKISQATDISIKFTHNNTIITDCIIGHFFAMTGSKNLVIRNSCINCFREQNSSENVALIENCNIPCFAYYGSTSYKQPYAIYRKCFLGLYNDGWTAPLLSLSSPMEFHEVNFYQNFRYASTSTYAGSWTISYGSCITSNVYKIGSSYNIGDFNITELYRYSSRNAFKNDYITVGPSDPKYYPTIPVIDSSEIDTETDDEGKLHVKISATARD